MAEHRLGSTLAICSGCINLVVTMGLEDVEDLAGSLEVVDARLLGAFLAEGHGSEDHIDVRFLCRSHFR